MSDHELCYLPATEAIRRFKARDLSPVELMQAMIDRAGEVEPTINAFTFEYFDEALGKARKAEAKYMKTDGRTRALEGLPIAIKDESYIKGKPTTNASLTMKDFRRRQDLAPERPDPEGGRHLPRPHRDAGILLRRVHQFENVGCDAQSVEPGVHARRIVRRQRGLAVGGHIHPSNRVRHRRLDPHSGVLLRARRLQGALRAQSRRSAVQSRFLLPHRAARRARLATAFSCRT